MSLGRTGLSGPITGFYPFLEYAWVSAPNAATLALGANTLVILTLDTEVADTDTLGSIASNKVTLPAGSYYFEAYLPLTTKGAGTNVIFALWNDTDSAYVTRRRFSAQHVAGEFASDCIIKGQFTIADSKDFELHAMASVDAEVAGSTSSNITAFTDSTAGLDQRTTIQLWKLN